MHLTQCGREVLPSLMRQSEISHDLLVLGELHVWWRTLSYYHSRFTICKTDKIKVAFLYGNINYL